MERRSARGIGASKQKIPMRQVSEEFRNESRSHQTQGRCAREEAAVPVRTMRETVRPTGELDETPDNSLGRTAVRVSVLREVLLQDSDLSYVLLYD